jgi:hypothetical protein
MKYRFYIVALVVITMGACSKYNRTIYNNKATAYHDSIAVMGSIYYSNDECYLEYSFSNFSNEPVFIDTLNYVITYNDPEHVRVSVNTIESGSLHGEKIIIKISPNSTFKKNIKLAYNTVEKFHLTLSYLRQSILLEGRNILLKDSITQVGKIFYQQNAKVFEITSF